MLGPVLWKSPKFDLCYLKGFKIKTGRREIHNEAGGCGDMQLPLCSRGNKFVYLTSCDMSIWSQNFLSSSCIHPELNLMSSEEIHLNWRGATARNTERCFPSVVLGVLLHLKLLMLVLFHLLLWAPYSILHSSFILPAFQPNVCTWPSWIPSFQ